MEDQPANGQPQPEDDGEPSTTEPQSELDRMKDLTRRLLKVPKSELDEQRQKA